MGVVFFGERMLCSAKNRFSILHTDSTGNTVLQVFSMSFHYRQ